LAGQFQPPEGVKAISVPATQIASEKDAAQAANTAMFGALIQAGNLEEAYGNAFQVTFAKKHKLIPLNLEILEAGGSGGQSAGEGYEEVKGLWVHSDLEWTN
jgi:2-oxoisovalerate ferredoxin oxidoreductase beta subunit